MVGVQLLSQLVCEMNRVSEVSKLSSLGLAPVNLWPAVGENCLTFYIFLYFSSFIRIF